MKRSGLTIPGKYGLIAEKRLHLIRRKSKFRQNFACMLTLSRRGAHGGSVFAIQADRHAHSLANIGGERIDQGQDRV
jgi:hypothetical protein